MAMSDDATTNDTALRHWLLTHQYALLNPLVIEQTEWQDLPHRVLIPPQVDVRPHLLPRLILLGQLDGTERLQLASRIERHRRRGEAYFCALLHGAADADQVAGHLQYQLVQRRGIEREPWWLRYYDPQVFRHLCWQLREDQLDRLLGPITQWCWPDGTGQWHPQRHQTLQPTLLPALFLTEQQWQGIDRIALLNRTLATLAVAAPELEQTPALWRHTDELLELAREYDLASGEDRALFAEQALRFHPRIHSHPALGACRERARRDGIEYSEACATLDDIGMSQLAAELGDTGSDHVLRGREAT